MSIRQPGNRGIFDIDEDTVKTALTTLRQVPTNWLPFYADKLPQRLELKKDNASMIKAKTKELMKIERFVVTRETEIGKVIKVINAEENLFVFAHGLEDRWGKQLSPGPNNKISGNFDENVVNYEVINELLLSVMVQFWEIDIKTAEAQKPTHYDLIVLDARQKGFGFGDKYKFMVCLGDPVIMKSQIKGKEFVLPEGCLLLPKTFMTTPFVNFMKYAPVKEEAKYLLKSRKSTLIIGFYLEN